MPLRRLVRSLAGAALPVAALALLTSCAKDVVRLDRNRPPQTFIVAAPLDSAGVPAEAVKSSYRVHLYWRGEDTDGYVVGFLWSFDDSSVGTGHYTTKTDSVFDLLVNDSTVFTGERNPGFNKYHTFFIRAVDNQGKADPNITVFNRRTFNAQTVPPVVRFVGGLPSHRKVTVWIGPGPTDSSTTEPPDTLADGAPFHVCWTARDPDNPPTFGVPHYQWSVGGNYTSPVTSDTCAFFNDPANPKSVGLASGLYTMTVKAFDVANAVGDSQFIFVVNYDPDTWFLPRGPAPIGHFIQPFLGGNDLTQSPITGTFHPGETVPYRSTVWWDWDGSDTNGGESNCISGWSLFLVGSRNNGEPYTTGFRHDLGPINPDRLFTTNDPAVVGPAGFIDLILDSLDAIPASSMQIVARSRDCSGRVDGTPAIFPFGCNFSPVLDSVAVDAVCAVNSETNSVEKHVRVSWFDRDYEDGRTTFTRITIDGTQNIDLKDREQQFLVPLSTFIRLSPGSTEGTVKVSVSDRAGQRQSNDPIEVRFPLPGPSCL